MKIEYIRIENIRNFKKLELNLKVDANVFIGPNGVGKSNLLDIINITLKRFFLLYYYPLEVSGKTEYRQQNLNETDNNHNIFNNINEFLDKCDFGEGKRIILLRFAITKEDIDNISKIKNNKDKFVEHINLPGHDISRIIDLLDEVKLGVYEYRINLDSNNPLENGFIDSEAETFVKRLLKKEQLYPPFFVYLRYINLFFISGDRLDIKLNGVFLYIGPNRTYSGGREYVPVDVNGFILDTSFKKIANIESRGTYSIIDAVVGYIGYKQHLFKNKVFAYHEKGMKYNCKFKDSDESIKGIYDKLTLFGYDWEIEETKKEYGSSIKLFILKDGKRKNISKMSSGEKQLFEFILGIPFLNLKGGLLIVDEPELHLHSVLIKKLYEYLIEQSKLNNIQLIIATHNSSIIKLSNISNTFYFSSKQIFDLKKIDNVLPQLMPKHKLHIINAQNNESIFFSKNILLVEGVSDKIIFEKLFEKTKVVGTDIISVGGKENLKIYKQMLEQLNVNVMIIADLDYLENICPKLKYLFKTDHTKIDESLFKKGSKDRKELLIILQDAIKNKDFSELKLILNYIGSRNRSIKQKLTKQENKQKNDEILNFYSENTFILKNGDIESYLPEGYNKHELAKTLEFVYDNSKFDNWLSDKKSVELRLIIKEIKKTIIN